MRLLRQLFARSAPGRWHGFGAIAWLVVMLGPWIELEAEKREREAEERACLHAELAQIEQLAATENYSAAELEKMRRIARLRWERTLVICCGAEGNAHVPDILPLCPVLFFVASGSAFFGFLPFSLTVGSWSTMMWYLGWWLYGS